MAIERMSSIPFSAIRPKRPTSDKLIFISCEGSVTEWKYFEDIINKVYANISSKVRVINVLEVPLKKNPKNRTSDEEIQITSSNPQNLLDKMNTYKIEKDDEYNFAIHKDDEFWLIMDIDDHTSSTIIDNNGKSNLDKWNDVLQQCKEKNYKYAVSNPFFELWLLLHFDEVNNEDYNYAVTSSNAYKSTSHFRDRLSGLGVPLKNNKHINVSHYPKYNKTAIEQAISRAEKLDTEPKCDYPTNLGSTVYRLLKSISEIDAQYETH